MIDGLEVVRAVDEAGLVPRLNDVAAQRHQLTQVPNQRPTEPVRLMPTFICITREKEESNIVL